MEASETSAATRTAIFKRHLIPLALLVALHLALYLPHDPARRYDLPAHQAYVSALLDLHWPLIKDNYQAYNFPLYHLIVGLTWRLTHSWNAAVILVNLAFWLSLAWRCSRDFEKRFPPQITYILILLNPWSLKLIHTCHANNFHAVALLHLSSWFIAKSPQRMKLTESAFWAMGALTRPVTMVMACLLSPLFFRRRKNLSRPASRMGFYLALAIFCVPLLFYSFNLYRYRTVIAGPNHYIRLSPELRVKQIIKYKSILLPNLNLLCHYPAVSPFQGISLPNNLLADALGDYRNYYSSNRWRKAKPFVINDYPMSKAKIRLCNVLTRSGGLALLVLLLIAFWLLIKSRSLLGEEFIIILIAAFSGFLVFLAAFYQLPVPIAVLQHGFLKAIYIAAPSLCVLLLLYRYLPSWWTFCMGGILAVDAVMAALPL